MEKKRILHVKNSLPYDGATVIEYRLAELLRDEFAFDWFLISDEEGVYEERFGQLGGQIFYCEYFKKKYKKRFPSFAFYSFLRKHRYNTVYFDTDFSGRSYWLLLARFAGVKQRIIHSHNSKTEGGINPVLHWFFKLIMRFSVTDYIACSRAAACWMFPKDKAETAVIVKNGIDTRLFTYNPENRKKIRALYNIPESSCVLGHVGRFCEQKNHSKLIGIFKEFHKIHPDSFLILIGDGELKNKIEQSVSELELSEYVKFVGNTDNVGSYLSAMDVFLLPSLFEGLPISVIEAECSGLYVYISDGISNEAILTSKTKKLSLSFDDKDWAVCIAKDLNSVVNNERMESVSDIINKGYDIKESAKIMRNLLE